ncbi:MAG TPA: hypothetical protein VFR87_19275 [Nocardioidaceae bacterium]|nr:hypothetical protein [Nocardioidaceae bacterium]
MRRGAAPESRRLLLGRPGGTQVAWVVAVAHGPRENNAVDNEEQVLRHAHRVLRTGLRNSIPEVRERIEVYSSLDGLLLTAVPGLSVGERRRTAQRTRELLIAMPRWIGGVWTDSASGTARTDLGAADVRSVLEQHQPIPRLEPAMDAIRRARLRIAEHEVPQTLTHGCLCPRHVTHVEGVVGVDDWGAGAIAGDPLRDVGRFAVGVAGGRLPEVLSGKSAFAGEIRQFLGAVLVHTPVPPQLWREVLVLAQLELAMESLERADPNGMHLLSRAVRLSRALTRTR